MSFNQIDVEEKYAQDAKLKREDVQAVFQWLKKQPHLPELTELQVLLFLHSCHYRIEAAKVAIDNYFTIREHCPDLFACASEEVVRQTLAVESMTILPRLTFEGYVILSTRLIDYRPEKYICIDHLKVVCMVLTLYLHQHGPVNGVIFLFDTKGATLGHLARVNLMAVKRILYFVQEAAPIRIKSIHYINLVPITEKLIVLAKPFLKKAILDLVNFHSGSLDTLYKYIPKECLPEDYGGELPSFQILHEENVKSLCENLDLLKWHDTQNVDESKRFGKPKSVNTIFGVEGTFKKLEID